MGVHWETKSGKKYPTELPGKPFLLEHVGPDAQDEYRCVVHSAKGEVVSSYARVAVYGQWRFYTRIRFMPVSLQSCMYA